MKMFEKPTVPLDRLVHEVVLNKSFSHSWAKTNMTTDETVRYTRDKLPGTFDRALQDPRYIAYCKEQDRKECEEAQSALDEGRLVSLEEIKGEVGLEVIH